MKRSMKRSRTKGLEKTVQNNMIILTSVILILVVGFVCVYNSYNRVAGYKKDLADSSEKSARLIQSEFDVYFQKSSAMLQDWSLIQQLQVDYDGELARMMEFFSYLKMLLGEPGVENGAGSFTLYPFNESIYEGNYVERYERIKDTPIKSQLDRIGDAGLLWGESPTTRKYMANEKFIVFYRYLKDFKKPVGILQANIPFAKLTDILDDTIPPHKSILVLKDVTGQVQYVAGDRDDREQYARHPAGKDYVGRTVTLANSFTVTAAMPKSVIVQSLLRSLTLTAAGLAVAIYIVNRVARYSAKLTLRRLKNFIDVLKNDDSLLLNQHLIPETTDGEIAVIERKFKSLISKIAELHQEAAAANLEKSAFELELLQAKINPHLLYNSLSVVKWNAQWNKDRKTMELIDHMVKYYRATLGKGSPIIKLSEELEMIRDYIRINEFSYSCKYLVHIQMEEEILDCYTFRHLLQPIVENTILHGLNGQEEDGEISISGWSEGGDIYIRIADTGVGMSERQVRDILAMNGPASAEFGGYGTKNLIRRIKIYYGEQYGLAIESAEGKGTEVIVHIAAIQEKQLLEKLS